MTRPKSPMLEAGRPDALTGRLGAVVLREDWRRRLLDIFEGRERYVVAIEHEIEYACAKRKWVRMDDNEDRAFPTWSERIGGIERVLAALGAFHESLSDPHSGAERDGIAEEVSGDALAALCTSRPAWSSPSRAAAQEVLDRCRRVDEWTQAEIAGAVLALRNAAGAIPGRSRSEKVRAVIGALRARQEGIRAEKPGRDALRANGIPLAEITRLAQICADAGVPVSRNGDSRAGRPSCPFAFVVGLLAYRAFPDKTCSGTDVDPDIRDTDPGWMVDDWIRKFKATGWRAAPRPATA